MSNYIRILEESLGKAFCITNYSKFIVNFLNGSKLKETSQMRSADFFAEYKYYIQEFALVAEYEDPQRKKVGIYAIKLKNGRDIEKARSKQRNFVAKLLSDNNFDAALAAFYTDDDTKWRLSFVRLDYEFAKGKVTQSLTPAKRYSYLVGEGEPCHTAKESLLPIFANEKFVPTIDSIESAFSVEKVTKQFFEIYREKYIELKEYLESISCFNDETDRKGFTSEQYAKKFMGQLVFLYFLQKKGWLGVKALPVEISESEYKKLFFANSITRAVAPSIYPKVDENVHRLNASAVLTLSKKEEESVAKIVKGNAWGTGSKRFVRDLFEIANKKQVNFFDEYLEPLFYDGLNKKREADNYYMRLHCRIPFLNGGLFEPLDNYDWENNFFSIPNEIFSNKAIKGERDADGILDIFDRYNFTMNEDEPLEKEVAVDPEMLGKIFENLLDVKDRKSKGAFYTPREIVHYMCQESLTNYLVNTVNVPYDDAHDFVLYGEIMKDEDCSRERREGLLDMIMPASIYEKLNEIDTALADVRVADPAVGSGAFPMGMLSEIVKLREIITEYFARDLDKLPEFVDWYKDKKVTSQLNAVRWKLRNEKRNSYVLKKETMRNSIYAVDIEPSAVDITKLRLWLTLVVEQEIDVNDPLNDSPIALPNLDCNIMCGNSLIDEFEGVDLSFDSILFGDEGQSTLWTSSIDIDLEKLFVLQREFFYADSHDKKEDLRQKIIDAKEKLINIAFDGASTDSKARFATANSLHSTPFFLWKLNFAKVFKDKGGFDIVMGNPPYVGHKGGLKDMFHELKKSSLGKRFNNERMDLFYYFYHLALDINNSNGCIAYITTNYFVTADSAVKLRKDINNRADIIQLINFNELKIFESAMGQHNIICLLGNGKKNRLCKVVVSNVKGYSKKELCDVLNNKSNNIALYSVTQEELFYGSAKNIVFKEEGLNSDSARIELILTKMSKSPRLGSLCNISQGVVSGLDKIGEKHILRYPSGTRIKGEGCYVLSKSERYSLFSVDNPYIKPWFKNSDILKYSTNVEPEQYLLYMNTDYNLGENLEVDTHLLKFEPYIKTRNYDSGELSKAKRLNKWWAMSSSRREFDFSLPKIVAPQRCYENRFGYNNVEWYASADVYFINEKENNNDNLKYVLAVLNSQPIYTWLYCRGKRKGEMLELYLTPLLEVPIPNASVDDKRMIVSYVDIIIQKLRNKESIDKIQADLDVIMSRLFGLNDEEYTALKSFNKR